MPRTVVVACESPRARAKNPLGEGGTYAAEVRDRVGRHAPDVAAARIDWGYVERLRAMGVDAGTAAALAVEHVGITDMRIVSAVRRGTGEAANNSIPPPAPEAPADGFTRVVRDPAAFAAMKRRWSAIGEVGTDRHLYRFVSQTLQWEDSEVFLVVGVDLHSDLRCCTEVARGQRDAVRVEPADVLRPVLIEGAHGFAVAHNHPSGDPKPSPADRELTRALKSAGDAVRLVFLDHLVVGQGRYYSFADGRVKRG